MNFANLEMAEKIVNYCVKLGSEWMLFHPQQAAQNILEILTPLSSEPERAPDPLPVSVTLPTPAPTPVTVPVTVTLPAPQPASPLKDTVYLAMEVLKLPGLTRNSSLRGEATAVIKKALAKREAKQPERNV